MENGSRNRATSNNDHRITENGHYHGARVNLYPLSHYYFGSKDVVMPFRDDSSADRIQRLNSNYETHGLRTRVEAVLLVELFQHPHLLLLQVRNSYLMLPGGRLRPGESDIDGLKRKLSLRLSDEGDGNGTDWKVGKCIGTWWRAEFEGLPCRSLLPDIRQPKECIKLFLVKLPASCKFIVPKNLKLLAVPLGQLPDNDKAYGPIISEIPHLLSEFSLNMRYS